MSRRRGARLRPAGNVVLTTRSQDRRRCERIAQRRTRPSPGSELRLRAHFAAATAAANARALAVMADQFFSLNARPSTSELPAAVA
jgi:hypothetical protein